MSQYQFKPNISVKYSPRIPGSTRALIERICRRYEMFEADVLRLCLEAIAPEAAKRGVKWLTGQIPRFEHLGEETYSAMLTVRTSPRVKVAVDALSARDDEAQILRYLFLAILPIAERDGFGPIVAMREKHLAR
jgi:hypothetical protein